MLLVLVVFQELLFHTVLSFKYRHGLDRPEETLPGWRASTVKLQTTSTNHRCLFSLLWPAELWCWTTAPWGFPTSPSRTRDCTRASPGTSLELRAATAACWSKVGICLSRNSRNCLIMSDWIPMDFAVFVNEFHTCYCAMLQLQLSMLPGGIKNKYIFDSTASRFLPPWQPLHCWWTCRCECAMNATSPDGCTIQLVYWLQEVWLARCNV